MSYDWVGSPAYLSAASNTSPFHSETLKNVCECVKGDSETEGGTGSRLGQGVTVVLSGVTIVSGKAHFVHSWVPRDQHPVSGAEGCGPQVRELGFRGAGNYLFHPLYRHSLGAP